MTAWKMPPKAKVYEALSAVGDQRVRVIDETHAQVTSSGGEKTYLVQWSEDGRKIASNDNASFWQGYMGYPIIAALMVRGLLDYTEDTARFLAGVPWKQVNRRFKRDYVRAVEHVLAEIEAKGGDRTTVEREAARAYQQLAKLQLERTRPPHRPPEDGR